MPNSALRSAAATLSLCILWGGAATAQERPLPGPGRARPSIHLAGDGAAPWTVPGDAVLALADGTDGWPAVAITFSILSLSASADEHGTIAAGEGWDLALYGTRTTDAPDALPAGGMALSLHPDGGWPAASLAIDYAGDDPASGRPTGLAFVASIDLVEPEDFAGTGALLRLTWRVPTGFGAAQGDDEGQIIALRAGLAW
ncbi:MAG: hypothetical protein IRY94_04745 [Rhodospirillaceae bacterium]|nr:hypothetical protein [Rhodospirillaceae bacterium]